VTEVAHQPCNCDPGPQGPRSSLAGTSCFRSRNVPALHARAPERALGEPPGSPRPPPPVRALRARTIAPHACASRTRAKRWAELCGAQTGSSSRRTRSESCEGANDVVEIGCGRRLLRAASREILRQPVGWK
jgi:hypothetical protein